MSTEVDITIDQIPTKRYPEMGINEKLRVYSRWDTSDWFVFSIISSKLDKNNQIITIIHIDAPKSTEISYKSLLNTLKNNLEPIFEDKTLKFACERWINDVDLEFRNQERHEAAVRVPVD